MKYITFALALFLSFSVFAGGHLTTVDLSDVDDFYLKSDSDGRKFLCRGAFAVKDTMYIVDGDRYGVTRAVVHCTEAIYEAPKTTAIED